MDWSYGHVSTGLVTHNISSSLQRAILIYLIISFDKGLGQSKTYQAIHFDRPTYLP